jgi:hypothetical protein
MLFAANAVASVVDEIVAAAYKEVANGTRYNTEMLDKYFPPTYRKGVNEGSPVYPNGDVAPHEGICADLVVRALRGAKLDLQKLVHRDVQGNQKIYGVRVPDKYIDHRRVWILNTFFKRNWTVMTTELSDKDDWRAGDIVIWDIGSKQHLHIGIVGKKKREDGFPLVIHNMRYVPLIFAGKTVEEDVLEGPKILGITAGKWKIIGHYRVL